MTTAFSLSRWTPVLAGVTALFLGACNEPEVILPGEREDIRSVPGEAGAATVNQNLPINLPAQKANTEWPQSFATPSFRTAHPALRSTPQRIWSTDIGSGDSRKQRINAVPVVGGGLIYTLDSGARVSAVAPSGGVVWSTELLPSPDDEGEATGGGLAYAGGTLYVSSGYGLLTALDARTGGQRWQQRLEATGSGAPTVRDGILYLVAGDDTGWAVDISNGRILWQISGTPSVGNVLGAPAPALSSDLVYFAYGSGDLIASFRRGGVRRWGASVAGQRKGRAVSQISDVTGAPVIVGSRLYAGNHSGRTVAFDAASGERIWTAREGALGPVWPAGDSLFLVSDRSQLVRLKTSDGSTVWAVDLPGYVKDKPRKRGPSYVHYGPILAGGRLIVTSSDGLLRQFDPRDGRLIGTVEIPDGATTAPVVAGSTLYVVSTKGQLHAFR